jgi:hypothetical protein
VRERATRLRVLITAFVVALAVALAAGFVLSGTSGAEGSDGYGVVDPAQTCEALRAQMGDEAFRDMYGTAPNGDDAFGRCVASFATGG